MIINIKKLTDTATIPTRGSSYAAGYDLYADLQESVELNAHETKVIPTGIAVEIPAGYFGGVFARSGLSLKEMLRPGNCTGVIDEDYTGEIGCIMHNDSEEKRIITPQERIAQLVIIPYLSVEFNEVDELNQTERGTDRFGSTDACR